MRIVRNGYHFRENATDQISEISQSGRHAVSLDTLQRLSDVLGIAFTIGPTKLSTARAT